MARKATTKTEQVESNVESVEAVEAAEETADVVEAVEEDVSVEEEQPKKAAKKVDVGSLTDDEEIEVVSLIPNVTYRDRDTYDVYEWEEVGHTEFMTFGTINNMWKRHKGYFRNLWLKPNDERVIKKLGLERIYDKYEYLMNSKNYTTENIDELMSAISSTSNDMKFSIVKKITDMVVNGELTNITVVRRLESKLNIELSSFLD